MKLDLSFSKKVLLSFVQWAVIGAAAWILLTAQTIKNNSELGRKSYYQLKGIDVKVDSLENIVNISTIKQEVINNATLERINKLSEDIKDTKYMVEQLYINLLEN